MDNARKSPVFPFVCMYMTKYECVRVHVIMPWASRVDKVECGVCNCSDVKISIEFLLLRHAYITLHYTK